MSVCSCLKSSNAGFEIAISVIIIYNTLFAVEIAHTKRKTLYIEHMNMIGSSDNIEPFFVPPKCLPEKYFSFDVK